MNKLVACGDFVKRQTKDSGFSHFNGSWEDLAFLVRARMAYHSRPGYRDGVILVDMPPGDFYSSIVSLDLDTKLVSSYAPRRPGELPVIRTAAKGKKQRANYASVVLYRKDVLEENNERQTDAEWEVVAIKARLDKEEEPMDPMTMARNFLHLQGGTKGDFSAEDFAKSIVYWNTHAMCQGKPKWYRKIATFFRQVLTDMREGLRRNAENMMDGKEP